MIAIPHPDIRRLQTRMNYVHLSSNCENCLVAVGFKLCVGQPEEFTASVHGFLETSIYPDFITVDGGEGGAGAAPPEFSNSIGTPLPEGLSFVQAVLVGAGFRDPVDK